MISTIWKIVPDTLNLYEASNEGDIRRVEGYVKNNINGGERLIKSTVLKPKTKVNGYKEVKLSLKGSNMSKYVHRLVALTFIGEIPEGSNVNHKDGDKSNNKLSNLEITTISENNLHSYRILGRKNNPKIGTDCHFSKINEQVVSKIKADLANGLLQKQIALRYSISQSHVSRIKLNISWRHLF